MMMPTLIIDAMHSKGADTITDITDEQLSWIGKYILIMISLVFLIIL